jgi:hypothetical protein
LKALKLSKNALRSRDDIGSLDVEHVEAASTLPRTQAPCAGGSGKSVVGLTNPD